MGGFENKQIIGWQNESELTRKIGSVSITIKRDEMGLDVPSALPPVRRECVLSNKATKFYVELKREFVADIEEGIVTADNALTRLMRLRQVCSGYTRTDEDRDVLVGDEKERLLADVLEDIPEGSPVVVFAAFHHDLDAIERVAKASGRTYAELSGRRRDALSSDATLMEGVDVAGVQLQSGGVGVDFTRSCYAIYYSLDYNLGNKLQSMARLDRPGQQEHVIFIYLVAKLAHGAQTVDELTLRALDNRQSFVDAIMEASRRGEL
jgi:SNF2 family DNA or RNA helicase